MSAPFRFRFVAEMFAAGGGGGAGGGGIVIVGRDARKDGEDGGVQGCREEGLVH